MKKYLAFVICILMIVTLFVGCGQQQTTKEAVTSETNGSTASKPEEANEDTLAGLQPIAITLAHGSPLEETSTIYCEKWIKAVEEKSGGKIIFKYYPAGQLGSLTELVEALETGVIDMSKSDPSLMDVYLPEIGILNLPFIIKDYEHAARVVDGPVGEALATKMSKDNNTHILGWYWNGFRVFNTKKLIKNVSDCKDILLRSPEGKVYIDTFNRLGMKPTPIPFGEMYTALQTGVVDGIETTIQTIINGDYHKVAKNVCESNHMISLNCITANTTFWNSLPQEYKDIMIECMAENVKEQRAAIVESDDSYYDRLKSEGGTLTQWDNYQELIDLFTPYWAEAAKKMGGDAKKLIDQIIDLN